MYANGAQCGAHRKLHSNNVIYLHKEERKKMQLNNNFKGTLVQSKTPLQLSMMEK